MVVTVSLMSLVSLTNSLRLSLLSLMTLLRVLLLSLMTLLRVSLSGKTIFPVTRSPMEIAEGASVTGNKVPGNGVSDSVENSTEVGSESNEVVSGVKEEGVDTGEEEDVDSGIKGVDTGLGELVGLGLGAVDLGLVENVGWVLEDVDIRLEVVGWGLEVGVLTGMSVDCSISV